MIGLLWSPPDAPAFLRQRSRRSLEECGAVCGNQPDPHLPVLILRAGAWLDNPSGFTAPFAVELPLIGFGLPSDGEDADAWRAVMRATGGFCQNHELPAFVSLYANAAAVHRLGWPGLRACMEHGLRAGAWPEGLRVVHLPGLDAGFDSRVRVLEIVTSLQTGGAEKVALDLTHTLPRHGVATRLVTIGSPLRAEWPAPPGRVELAGMDRVERAQGVSRLCRFGGYDLLHTHLVDAEDVAAFSRTGRPMVQTIHNTRESWPAGLRETRPEHCALLIACSRAVERDLRADIPAIPARVAWNGVDVTTLQRRHADWRAHRARPRTPWVIACIANPRPQKRLELLPAVLRAVQELARPLGQRVRLVIAGETSPHSESATACRRQVDQEARRCGVEADITWTEGRIPVEQVLADSDAVVSCSRHEGLSLAHLETLAAGLPLIATDAGGTREIAAVHPGLTLLPVTATPADIAVAVFRVLSGATPPAGQGSLADFTLDACAARHAVLFAQVLATSGPSRPARGVWFITNNLSTGGAQSSLRRLVSAMHAEGDHVRVAVLQEISAEPTAGRSDLLAKGVTVEAIEEDDPVRGVLALLSMLHSDPPRTVVFWNVMPEWKVRFADALRGPRMMDVSPGEMFFASFDRFFSRRPPGLPIRSARDYGERLASVVVKFRGELATADQVLGTTVRVIPNGVAEAEPVPRLGGTVFCFGTAARLSPQKRLEDLIEAFRLALPHLPACELVVAGKEEPDTSDYAARLRDAATGLPVRWIGEPPDMAAFRAELDAFVMISEPAGCPNASLEALACGLPVIATAVGGAGEQVINEITGLLTPSRDAPALARAMVRMASDPGLRAQFSLAGRAHAQRHFSMQTMVAAYRSLIFGDDDPESAPWPGVKTNAPPAHLQPGTIP